MIVSARSDNGKITKRINDKWPFDGDQLDIEIANVF